MLKTTDIVKVADQANKGKVKYYGTFTRPYLSRAATDETETETVKIPTTDDGEVEVEVTSPKTLKDDSGKTLSLQTTGNPNALLKEALDYLELDQKENVSDPKDHISPVLILLSLADDGLVSKLRMKRRNELIPAEIDEDKALLKQATVMSRANPKKFPTVESAMVAIRALYAA